ncbi:hypothetical protein NC651_011076 [Populus alba x Populus x berolinensis]|nr:hypothetical protein NC651_011076 [Populus alba x Populus x berolinensis]
MVLNWKIMVMVASCICGGFCSLMKLNLILAIRKALDVTS